MRILTRKAIQSYKTNAKDHKELPIEVLKRRINALIESATQKKFFLGGTEYIFGSLHIKVDQYSILEIWWDDLRKPANKYEVKLMRTNFKKYGLNNSGYKLS